MCEADRIKLSDGTESSLRLQQEQSHCCGAQPNLQAALAHLLGAAALGALCPSPLAGVGAVPGALCPCLQMAVGELQGVPSFLHLHANVCSQNLNSWAQRGQAAADNAWSTLLSALTSTANGGSPEGEGCRGRFAVAKPASQLTACAQS